MKDLLTTENILFLALFFCMGAKYLGISINGKSVVFRGEKPTPEEHEQ